MAVAHTATDTHLPSLKLKTNVATQVPDNGIRWQVHRCAFQRAEMSTLARAAETTETEPHNLFLGQDLVYERHILIIHAYRSADVVVQVCRWYSASKRLWFRNTVLMETKLP
jgi:hypothetical protein